jgi:hypothetical protein
LSSLLTPLVEEVPSIGENRRLFSSTMFYSVIPCKEGEKRREKVSSF